MPAEGTPSAREAVTLVRELIDRIVVTLNEPDQPLGLELVGNLAGLMTEQQQHTGAISVVAGVGFEPTTFRL